MKKRKSKEYKGKKVTLEGVLEKKGRLRINPSTESCSFRFLFLIKHETKLGKKLTLCSCFIGNDDLELVDSIRAGMPVKLHGMKISRTVYLDSIKDMEILAP